MSVSTIFFRCASPCIRESVRKSKSSMLLNLDEDRFITSILSIGKALSIHNNSSSVLYPSFPSHLSLLF